MLTKEQLIEYTPDWKGERFPDGQLFVNLRGYDPTGSAMKPAEAVRTLLAAFDVLLVLGLYLDGTPWRGVLYLGLAGTAGCVSAS